MKIAIKRKATTISEDGRVAGHDAGSTLVRRFLRLFPDAQIIGPALRRCHGFDMVPLEFIDPQKTIIVNMDVLDSMDIWTTVYQQSGGQSVKLMNFIWWPVSHTEDEVVSAASLALSCALFPTFANSERTGSEIQELINRFTVPGLSENAKLRWVNLGFRLDHIQPRQKTDVPVVLYPAIYLSEIKNPDTFMTIVDSVRQRVPLQVEMRLTEPDLTSTRGQRLAELPWVQIGPLTTQRKPYWEALAHTTAFLATAAEESYGLSYVEAMGAGAIGVFPDLPWAVALLPEGYPYLYRTPTEAEELLYRALTKPEKCRYELDSLVPGGSFGAWIRDHHSDDAFDVEVTQCLNDWFGMNESGA